MTASESVKQKSPVLEQVAIIVVLVAIVILGLFSAYRWFVKEPTISPQELEIQELTQQVNASPGNKDARLLLAHAYQKTRDYTKATEQYNEVLKQDPKELAALYNLGLIAKEQKNLDQAEDFLKKVIAAKSTHVLGSLGLAEVYIEKGKYDDAIKLADKVLAIQGQMVNPRLLKALALEKKGDKPAAVREYREVLKYIPGQKEALAALERLK